MPIWSAVPTRLTASGAAALFRTTVPTLSVSVPVTNLTSVYDVAHGLGHRYVRVEVRDLEDNIVEVHWEPLDDNTVRVVTLALVQGTIFISP